MILRLRRVHRRATLAAALLAAAGLAGAVLAHAPRAAAVATPAALGALELPPLPVGARLLGESRLATATARLYAVKGGPALLELHPDPTDQDDGASAPADPDVLLYWAPGGAADTPDGAFLLGAAPSDGAPRRYALPEPARDGSGRLLLWSLGHHALVASGAMPAAAATPAAKPAPKPASGAPR